MKNWIHKNSANLWFGAAVLAIVACTGGSIAWMETRQSWHLSHEPMTAEERAAVAAMTERIMSATPRQLAGHDQDWDDAMRVAYKVARETHCEPRLFEYRGMRRTGQWKAVNPEAKP